MFYVSAGEFEVGDKEKHKVSFEVSRFWGWFTVKVDGVEDPIISKAALITGPYSVTVGDKEKHTVTFQIILIGIMPALRRPKIQVLIDNQLYKTF